MRIIAGEFKGRTLLQPPLTVTRPTTDKIRQAIFNILEHKLSFNFENQTVLDTFAGSGAMGFEALSRGAKSILSVEKSKVAFSVLKQNKKNLHLKDDQCSLILADILKTTFFGKKFNLVFLDPPYTEMTLYQQTIDYLINNMAIDSATILCIEMSKNSQINLTNINLLDERLYGDIKICFYKI